MVHILTAQLLLNCGKLLLMIYYNACLFLEYKKLKQCFKYKQQKCTHSCGYNKKWHLVTHNKLCRLVLFDICLDAMPKKICKWKSTVWRKNIPFIFCANIFTAINSSFPLFCFWKVKKVLHGDHMFIFVFWCWPEILKLTTCPFLNWLFWGFLYLTPCSQ